MESVKVVVVVVVEEVEVAVEVEKVGELESCMDHRSISPFFNSANYAWIWDKDYKLIFLPWNSQYEVITKNT